MDISTPVSGIHSAPVAYERGQWRLAMDRFLEHRLAVTSILVLLGITLAAVFAPFLSPYDAENTDLLLRFESPSSSHLMGTDALGRDLLTRILYGGRVSLTIGVLATITAITIGTTIGGISGYYGRWLDSVLMRLVDAVRSIPRLFLLILFAVFFGGKLVTVIVVLGALSWTTTARLVRAMFLSLKERDYVLAARAVGARDRDIMTRHILPNAIAPVIVAATLGVAATIIAESTLSFLGLGVQPPTPTWGNMLKDATTDMGKAPWTAIFPGVAIFLTVVAINFIGDGLRDAFDPRHAFKAKR